MPFEKRVLRRIFESKKGEIAGGWRKLHNEELHNFYLSACIIRLVKSRMMKWEGHAARMRVKMNSYRILVRKPEG
jgi:hypothetical protein